MSFFELLLIAIGLSMDAFAVSITKGLTMKEFRWKYALLCGIYFGLFQAGMPVIGYFLGYGFKDVIESFDHWVAFIVLAAIGISMIRGATADEIQVADETKDQEINKINAKDFAPKAMIILAIATSIDALAVGVSFAFLGVNIWTSVLLIGLTTFLISTVGAKIGSIFGTKYKKRAELAGGIILILIGFKILLEHLGIL